MFGIIYKITSKIDGKRYIGQTVGLLSDRWRVHCSKHSECTYMSNAIQKYGAENFEIQIIAKCNSIEELNHREEYYIKLFNSLAPIGYNLMTGGNNSKFSEEAKQNLSFVQSKEKNGFFGKLHSEESKSKMSKSRIGKTSAMLGKIHSNEVKKKIGAAHVGKIESLETRAKKSASKTGSKNNFFGRKHSEETKRKISESRKNRLSQLGV